MDEPSPRTGAGPDAKAKRWSLAALVLAAVVAVGGVIGTAVIVSGREPEPDASLAQTTVEADDSILGRIRLVLGLSVVLLAIAYGVSRLVLPHSVMSDVDHLEIDLSTLESFESYRGIEPWYATDAYGNPCLVLIETATVNLVGATCTPREGELIADVGAWPVRDFPFAEGLPDGSILRFHHRGDSVDAFVHPAAEADG